MIKLAGRFVPLKVNAEKEGRTLASKYKVNGFPTLLFVDSGGVIWGQIGGYVPPSGFIEQATPVVDLYSQFPKVQATLKNSPNDGAANCTMARVEAVRGNASKAEEHLKRAEGAKFAGPELAKAYNGVGDHFQTGNQFDTAIGYFLKGRSASKNPGDASYSLVSIMACYESKRDMTNAKKYAKMLVELKGATPEYVEYAKQMLGGQ